MQTVTLKAHYDGKQICPGEPWSGTQLLATLISSASAEAERMAWLARAYGEHEPAYSGVVLREEPPCP